MLFPFPTVNNNSCVVYALFAGVKRKPPGCALLETVGNPKGQHALLNFASQGFAMRA